MVVADHKNAEETLNAIILRLTLDKLIIIGGSQEFIDLANARCISCEIEFLPDNAQIATECYVVPVNWNDPILENALNT